MFEPRSQLVSLAAALLAALPLGAQAPHAVCATTPDLAALCRAIGGERVEVTSLTKGEQDPHFVDARPSMVRAVNRAEMLVETGRDLEIGWLGLLVQNGRNRAVLPGGPGSVRAAEAVRALNVPAPSTDRSHGDVHAGGNPHFLLDPLCGLQVARLLAARFAARWPAGREHFTARLDGFRRQLAAAMVGEQVAALYEHDAETFAELFPSGRLEELLREHGDLERLGGWFGALRPWRGAAVVADHDLWPYFAERCGLRVVGFCEPKPGIAPTTSHLAELVERMRSERVGAILAVPYFAPQHVGLLARATGARIAPMAHQPGARPDTGDYVQFVDHNVRAVVEALRAARDRGP